MKNDTFLKDFISEYSTFKNEKISGRYLSFDEIEDSLKVLSSYYTIKEIGRSFLNIPIHSVKVGSGKNKILAWSQMHGNESTTTKAVFDLFNLFRYPQESKDVQNILERCTFLVIPMLNPDGAARYTRENVNGVDLNRDAHELKEVESRVLRRCYEEFEPDFCFNLHDQRTIFGAGATAKPATISFLSPSMDQNRSLTEVRVQSMQIIAAMNKVLQVYIPNQVGRYDDAFNINCTGDTFQSLKTPTILFEAGHFKEYMREDTRMYMALAIFSGLKAIAETTFLKFTAEDYMSIPENRKNFYDIILRNANNNGRVVDIALQFTEFINGEKVIFEPVVQKVSATIVHFGHQEIDCDGKIVKNEAGKFINENDIVSSILLNNEELSMISQNIT